MTIQECYEAIGGNYEDVLRRLPSEALIRKFTLKFLEDQSYPLLKQSLGDNNYEEAFRGAHTLKGAPTEGSARRAKGVQFLKRRSIIAQGVGARPVGGAGGRAD